MSQTELLASRSSQLLDALEFRAGCIACFAARRPVRLAPQFLRECNGKAGVCGLRRLGDARAIERVQLLDGPPTWLAACSWTAENKRRRGCCDDLADVKRRFIQKALLLLADTFDGDTQYASVLDGALMLIVRHPRASGQANLTEALVQVFLRQLDPARSEILPILLPGGAGYEIIAVKHVLDVQ